MAFENGSAQMALALAAFFVAPSTLVAAEAHLPAETLTVLSGEGLAATARNRALSAALGFDDMAFGPDFRDRLVTSETCQLACRFVLSPQNQLDTSLRHLAAAIFQTRLRMAVLKTQREAVVATLGEEALQSGLRQAPVFAAALSALAPVDASDAGGYLPFAASVAVALATREDPVLGRILEARQPEISTQKPSLTVDQAAAAWRVIEGQI